MSQRNREDLRRILTRAFNKNQILILNHIDNGFHSLSFALRELSKSFGVPLSTLKLNAKILKELDLIDFGNSSNFKKPELTENGRIIINILGEGER